jgi:hypothetical protein
MTAPKQIKTLVERFERNREAYRSKVHMSLEFQRPPLAK